jgi:hypothetical protein
LQAEAEPMQGETGRILAPMDDQSRRIMRDLGVNLRIVHRDTRDCGTSRIVRGADCSTGCCLLPNSWRAGALDMALADNEIRLCQAIAVESQWPRPATTP